MCRLHESLSLRNQYVRQYKDRFDINIKIKEVIASGTPLLLFVLLVLLLVLLLLLLLLVALFLVYQAVPICLIDSIGHH